MCIQQREKQQQQSCPYHDVKEKAATALTKTKSKVASIQQRCVWGYTGKNFDDAIKPLLLLYLFGSSVGTLFFAVFSDDGSRSFVLSTCGHLIPEVILWSHMLFPPATTRKNQQLMWTVRGVYLLGFAVMCLWPVSNNKVGPVITGTYMFLSGISDFLAFWLGLLLVTRRTHHGVRRLGIAFFIHGAGFHLNAFEFCGGKLWEGMGLNMNLTGSSWFILLLVTTFAFLQIPPLFKEPLDLRHQTPTQGERKFVFGGVLTSFLTIPPLAAGGGMEAMKVFPKLLSHPEFLPTDSRLLLPYKIVCPLMSLLLCTHVLRAYIDADLPILPLSTQHQRQQQHEISRKQLKM